MAMRAATSQDHERVDRVFSAFVLDDAAGYAAFLAAQAGAFLPLEAAIERSEHRHVVADWAHRRRASLLRADLAELGVSGTHQSLVANDLTSVSEVLGVVYVLEGSRLGGAMLARAIPASFPKRFMTAADPLLWRSLIELLENQLASEYDYHHATSAAKAAFGMFERSARHQLELV